MQTTLEKLLDLNQLVQHGHILRAFDTYYHPDVIMQENESDPTTGKSANYQREADFEANVSNFSAIPLKTSANGNYSFVEWQYDYHHREWGHKQYKQVSVQEWKDGLIIREKFYYAA
ncbi:nuclear transport factor 2 family protein [Larkinella bovis]|uniref:Nuclear transport factor 2 family protein n=1 Tax=Larkinella bovis TaxID=683041 RepID=A0ABW0I8P4_9BACT